MRDNLRAISEVASRCSQSIEAIQKSQLAFVQELVLKFLPNDLRTNMMVQLHQRRELQSQLGN